ncbi:MAG: carboxypeptidase-like regulatory domain-containing protein [Bacteroidota bacterium]
MYKIILLSILIILLAIVSGNSQTVQDSATINTGNYSYNLKGVVRDVDNQKGLPYTNIYVLQKNIGAISNEIGDYLINISDLDRTDTIRFQYIGYKTKKISVADLLVSSDVYLKEEIFNLSETIIFGNELNARSIVKNVLINKESNYKKSTAKRLTFIRKRDISDIVEVNLKYMKSSFDKLDKGLLKVLEENIPKHSTSYTDFLGDLYFSANEEDSITFKIDPTRTVSLKEKDIAELEQIATIFENIFKSTKEDEYWKIKSGILSQKIDIEDDEVKTDSVIEEPKKDSLKEHERLTKYFARSTKYRLKYSSLDDENDWEFLHSTGKYKYTLAGGTRVNGEDVYIIDFVPKGGGEFIGRMYISMSTYALIRADYEYAPDKTGRDIHLFGVGYTENMFSGSIYFEKQDSTYSLKYLSKKAGSYASFDRNIAILKKRKRFLFDKKLKEIKIGVDISLNSEQSVEILFLSDEEINHQQFLDFEQKEKMEIIYVDQFDDKLWKGFSIIEPTKQMREYKKQEVN